jgi:hypothetical protein
MPSFTPPTARQSMGGDRLFSRFGSQVGQSVVKADGVYRATPVPWQGELQELTAGVEYFLGGHEYTVTEDIAVALEGDGFTVERGLGYGEGDYGDDGFGD